MVECLKKCGVNTTLLHGVGHGGSSEHETTLNIMVAEKLSTALIKYPIDGVQKVRKINPEKASAGLHGKTGIIFFKDYWQRNINGKIENFRNKSGDHIDLWNGSKLTSLSNFHYRLHDLSLGTKSYYNDVELGYNTYKEILFWRVS